MFRSLFNRGAHVPEVPEMLGLTLGRTVTIDPIELRLMPKDSLIEAPETGLRVVAQGLCDLGEQSFLHRFYPDDDRYLLQIQGGDGLEDTRVDEIMLWFAYDVHYPSQDADWTRFKTQLRQPGFELPTDSGKILYERAWFDPGAAQEEPMTYWETVRERRETAQGSKIFQTAMLFARALSDGRDEMLLVNLEEPEDGDRAVSFLVGRTIPAHTLHT